MEEDKGITAWFHSGEPTRESKYLPTDVIFDIHQDVEGYLWLTTFGSGLIQFNPRDFTYKQLTVREGLAHNVTNDILEDDFGNLWISTNYGLVCLNRESGNFVNFDKSDGLHIDEFNKKASAKLEDGRLIFGGLNGFVVFHPEGFLKEQNEETSSNLRITQLIIGDKIRKSIDITQPIILKNNKIEITFDLLLLEFSHEETAIYAWKWKHGKSNFKVLPSFQLHLSEVPFGKSTIVFRAKSAKGIPALNELEVSFLAPPLFSKLQIILGVVVLLSLYYFLFLKNKKDKSVTHKAFNPPTKEEITTEIVSSELKIEKKKLVEKLAVPAIILSPTDKKWISSLAEAAQRHDNIGKVSVEDMANEMNISSRQLNRKVKQLTGITPNKFLRDIKLEKAKRLLDEGAVTTVAEASFAVGFEKPDYFSRLFKEKYGKRPVSYFDKKKARKK